MPDPAVLESARKLVGKPKKFSLGKLLSTAFNVLAIGSSIHSAFSHAGSDLQYL